MARRFDLLLSGGDAGRDDVLAALLFTLQPPPPSQGSPQGRGVITADDYPRSAVDAGEEGAVAFEALIAPDGTVDKCTVIVSSHYPVLDQATCRIVEARATFAPAQGPDGQPAYGIFRSVITWSLGNVISGNLDPQLELQVNQAPPGVKLPLTMKLSYWTQPDGRATGCKLSNESSGAPTVLAELACNSILSQPPEVITNSKNQPVKASNNMVVRFSLNK